MECKQYKQKEQHMPGGFVAPWGSPYSTSRLDHRVQERKTAREGDGICTGRTLNRA